MSATKFLVVGDVQGQFKELAKTIERVHRAQGPFAFAVCCGKFFRDGCSLDSSLCIKPLADASSKAASAAADAVVVSKIPAPSGRLIEESVGSPPTQTIQQIADLDEAAAASQGKDSDTKAQIPSPTRGDFSQGNSLATNEVIKAPDSTVISSKERCISAEATSSPANDLDSMSEAQLSDAAAREFLQGSEQFAIPVYFVDSSLCGIGSHLRRNFPNGLTVSDSLHFLGAFGIRTISGLSVAYLSGRYDPTHFFEGTTDEEDIELDSALNASPSEGGDPSQDDSSRDEPRDSKTDQQTAPTQVPNVSAGPTTTSPPAGGEAASEPPSVSLEAESLEAGSQKSESSESLPSVPTSDNPNIRDADLSSQLSSGLFRGAWGAFYCRSVLQQFKDATEKSVGSVDVLVTCEWPAGVDQLLSPPAQQDVQSLVQLSASQRAAVSIIQEQPPSSMLHPSVSSVIGTGPMSSALQPSSDIPIMSPAVSELVEYLEPRFHIAAGLGVFYQRPLFRASTFGLASRFIAVGSMSTGAKAAVADKRLKYVHALNLKPCTSMARESLLATPATCGPSPYFALYNPSSAVPTASLSTLQREVQTGDLGDSPSGPHRNKRVRQFGGDTSFSHYPPQQPSPYLPTTAHYIKSQSPFETNPVPPPPSVPEIKRLRYASSLSSFGSTSPLSADSHRPYLNHRDVNNDINNTIRGDSIDGVTDVSNSLLQTTAIGAMSNSADTTNTPPTSNRVFVANIPYEVDKESFLDVMSSFGPISHIEFPISPEGKSIGKAWITYNAVQSAQKAVQADQQLESNSRLLKIGFSTPRQISNPRLSGSEGPAESGRYSSGHHPSQQFSTSINGLHIRPPRVSTPQAIDVRPHQGCWFCVSNPNCEKRLIVTIGDKVYIALAKGGLVQYHALILPVTHYPNFVFCPPNVANEMNKYIEQARRIFREQGMDVIVYERYFPMKDTKGMHMQLQLVPLRTDLARRSGAFFQEKATALGLVLSRFGQDETIVSLKGHLPDTVQQPYFYLEVPGSGVGQIERFVCVCPTFGQKKMPFNFGRETIADLMEMSNRAAWQNCVEPESTETKLAQELQRLFDKH